MQADDKFTDIRALENERIGAHRPLRLRLGTAPAAHGQKLIPQRVFGSESICGGLDYRVLCISRHDPMPLKDFIGQPIAIDFVTDRGNLRSVCGIVTEASAGDCDGAMSSYQLLLRDGLHIMEKRRNTRVFQQRSDIDVVTQLLDEWCGANGALQSGFEYEFASNFDIITYPKRDFIMQHNESDAAFVRRLLKRCGVAWFFKPGHSRYRSKDARPSPNAVHTLVLFNRADALAQNAAGAVRYHGERATEQRDTLTSWSAVRSLQAGSTTRHYWDSDKIRARTQLGTWTPCQNDQGRQGKEVAAGLDDYLVLPQRSAINCDDLQRLGELAVRQHDYASKCFHAEGNVRDLCAGEYFALQRHPEIDKHPALEREFVVTDLQLAAQNNLPPELTRRAERLFARNRWLHQDSLAALASQSEFARQIDDGPLRLHIQITAVRRGIAIVPAYHPASDLPATPIQSAVVVGPPGRQVYCDAQGRVQVRFPATRAPDHKRGGASDDCGDSAWIRVASNWAGSGPGGSRQCGALGLPRVGSEVLLAFAGGDPDQPIIIGQLYNRLAAPVSLTKCGDSVQKHYLSGLKSLEIDGRRGNQLRFDDATGRIAAQLASDHGASQLNLGWLKRDGHDRYDDARGEGAELRSDEQLALRGGKGILLSAWKRLDAGGKQMDRSECLALMEDCLGLFRSLGKYAAQQQALAIDDAAQAGLHDELKTWEAGSNTEQQGSGGGAPAIAITAPAGISFATSKSIISYACGNIDSVAQQHMQLTAGQRYNLNAGKGISLFAHADGIRAIAHHGPLLLQSQHDDTTINAGKNLRLTAGDGKLSGMADEIVLIARDGSFIRIGDGITIGSKSALHFNAPSFVFNDPQTMQIDLPVFGTGQADQKFVFEYDDAASANADTGTAAATAEPELAPQQEFEVKLGDGSDARGNSDQQGATDVLLRDAMHLAQVTLFNRKDQ